MTSLSKSTHADLIRRRSSRCRRCVRARATPGRRGPCARRRTGGSTAARAADRPTRPRPRRAPGRRARTRCRSAPRPAGAQPAAPSAQATASISPVTSQPTATNSPGRSTMPSACGRDRELADRAEQPGGDLAGGQQAERELADPPAEPDRRLTQADAADRDLTDREHADRDLADGDDADRRRAPPARRIDAANDMHERQPQHLQPRPVFEARRARPPRSADSPSVRA